MDILELLKKDHDLVNALLQEIINTGDADQEKQKQTLEKVKKEIFLHNKSEEETFYNYLVNHLRENEMIDDSYDDHEKVEKLLEEINAFTPGDDEWLDKIREIKDNFTEHRQKEEQDIFEVAKKYFQDGDRKTMAENFLESKEKIRVSIFAS